MRLTGSVGLEVQLFHGQPLHDPVRRGWHHVSASLTSEMIIWRSVWKLYHVRNPGRMARWEPPDIPNLISSRHCTAATWA